VFSTKDRFHYFPDPQVRKELHAVLAGKAKAVGCNPIIVGGVADHVHLLTTLSRTVTIADSAKEIKRGSNQWVKDQLGIKNFSWQSGYGAFSVSKSNVAAVTAYIANQEIHHQKIGFQNEFRQLLEKHGIEFDERYVWD
jgi:REP element-mobilizing transposase RayT